MRYLQPVRMDVEGLEAASESERDPESLVEELASHLYFIALSASKKAAAVVPPVPMLELLDRLERFSLSSESRTRLAVLRGVAACFRQEDGIPVLVCEPRLATPLSEMIEEILEDAYLLEASKLRTFFSPAANWAALRRDLRRILGWVIRHRTWAKGAVHLGEQVVAVPGQVGTITDLLGEIVVPPEGCPILLTDSHSAWKGDRTVVQLKYPGAVAVFPRLD